MTIRAAVAWSGGKDSALALHRVQQAGEVEVGALLTTLNEQNRRISMHGVREELLEAQATALGLPLVKVLLPGDASMAVYDERMGAALAELRAQGTTHIVFGDLFLAELRAYREERSAQAGLATHFPLWGADTATLAQEFIELGFRAVTVCVSAHRLDRSYVGREMDRAFFASLPPDVDPCGENGEYHSFVHSGPLFARPLPVILGRVVRRSYRSDDDCVGENAWDTDFWYQDLLLPEAALAAG